MLLLPFCRRGEWGYLTRSGEIAIAPRFAWAGPFREGLARVSPVVQAWDAHEIVTKGAFAYIDETGAFALSERFDQACDVSAGLGCVIVDATICYAHYDGRDYFSGGSWGYVDRTGYRLQPQFDYAEPFAEELAAVKRKDSWSFVDRDGRERIAGAYKHACSFSEGLAAVQQHRSDRYGFIDRTGAMVIAPRWSITQPFQNGLAAVFDRSAYRYFYIDKSGAIETEVAGACRIAFSFSEGLAAAEHSQVSFAQDGTLYASAGGLWGFIDRTGRYVIEPCFQSAGPFCGGLAPVLVDRHWGFIDLSGQIVIEPSFDMAATFENGPLAYVRRGGDVWYLDLSQAPYRTLGAPNSQ